MHKLNSCWLSHHFFKEEFEEMFFPVLIEVECFLFSFDLRVCIFLFFFMETKKFGRNRIMLDGWF